MVRYPQRPNGRASCWPRRGCRGPTTPSLGNCAIAATWFEYAPDYEAAFDDLLTRLRATPEWAFVEREVDIRLEGEMHNGTP